MKRKVALAVFSNPEDADKFYEQQTLRQLITSKKVNIKLVVAPDLIKEANKRRNLRLAKQFKELKSRYLDKHWPEPSWIEFQKHESTLGRDYIQTNTLLNKTIPKAIQPKSIGLITCEKFVKKLTILQKIELKILIDKVPQ